MITAKDYLSQVPLFANLDAETLKSLAAACRVHNAPAHHTVFATGDPLRDAKVLITGSVKRATLLATGAEKLIELVDPLQVFPLCELFSPSHALPTSPQSQNTYVSRYTSYAQTLGPSTLLHLDADAFRQAVRSDPVLAIRIVEILAHRQCEVEFEIVHTHTSTVAQRVLDFLVSMAGDRIGTAGETTVLLEPSKQLIASRIGMAPETFSRTLRQLSESGAIVVEGRRVHIQNAALTIQRGDSRPEPMRFLRRSKIDDPIASGHLQPGTLINLCGRQRMLSQRMATVWAMIGRRISPAAARITLKKCGSQFEANLERLCALAEQGTLTEPLDLLRKRWPEFRKTALEQEPDYALADRMFVLSEKILDAADQLTRAAEKHSGTPEAHRVNIAGRNRMISHRLTKLFLFSDWSIRIPDAKRYSAVSRREFVSNLSELLSSGAHIPEIAAQLRVVSAHWNEFTTALDNPPERKNNQAHARAVLAASEELLRTADTTVKLYERLAD